MTLAETERLTSLLRTKETELSHSLRNRDEIVIEKASDALYTDPACRLAR